MDNSPITNLLYKLKFLPDRLFEQVLLVIVIICVAISIYKMFCVSMVRMFGCVYYHILTLCVMCYVIIIN